MRKPSIKEILVGAIACELNCSEICLEGMTKEQLKRMWEEIQREKK